MKTGEILYKKKSLEEIRNEHPHLNDYTKKLKNIIEKYNFYPHVYYHEGNLNDPHTGIRSNIPDLDDYDGIFMVVEAPDVAIDNFQGVEIRPSITRGVSDRQILIFYDDYTHLEQFEPQPYNTNPIVWFSGDVVLMQNNQLFPQQQARYASIINASTCGLTTHFDMRITKFNKGTFEYVSGNRLDKEDYFEQMKQYAYGLAVRGWGNYSVRFYELMARGRIPIHIDSGDPLLFEDEIEWSDYIVNITNLNNMKDDVLQFNSKFDDTSFIELQNNIRKLYTNYCTFDAWIHHFNLLEDKINTILSNKRC